MKARLIAIFVFFIILEIIGAPLWWVLIPLGLLIMGFIIAVIILFFEDDQCGTKSE